MAKLFKKVMTVCLAAAMIITAIYVIPKTADAAEGEVESGEYVYSRNYSIADYWKEDVKKVPVKPGCIFGGWYTSEDGQTFKALKEKELNTNGVAELTNVYAKFVPSYVLSIKMQIEAKEQDAETRTTDNTTLRVISSVDSNEYQKVGFEIFLGKRSNPEPIEPITTVYAGLKRSAEDTEALKPENVFGAASHYFSAVDIGGIVNNSRKSAVSARPYWVTMDGTKVEGLAKIIRVEDFYNENDYISVPINLATDGKVAAVVAAGKIEVSYDTTAYQIVGVDNDYKVDAGRLLPEMNYRVVAPTAGEQIGKIIFVANAADMTELEASGLFANIRFQALEDSASESDIIHFDTTQFCDWKENFHEETDIIVQ